MWYSGLSLGFGVREFERGFESCVALNKLSNLSGSQFSGLKMGIITVIPTSLGCYEDQVKMDVGSVYCKV